MALKHSQQLRLSQKLLPQQILLMKLLQLPTLALEERIKEELEANPALEEDLEKTEEEIYEEENQEPDAELDDNGDIKEDENKTNNDVEMEDYMDAEELDSYKYDVVNKGKDDESREFVVVEGPGLREQLEQQLSMKNFTDQEFTVGVYLIGCIDEDGYIRRELELIVDDLAFNYNITTSIPELKKMLKVLQEFDPAGICARNLQECLLIQLDRKIEKTKEVVQAMDVVKNYMEEFSRKHYEKILKGLKIDNEELKEIINVIKHLNPRPGSVDSKDTNASEVIPDFTISVNDGKAELSLNGRNTPDLKISKDLY